MTDESPDWCAIEAAYRAGMAVTEMRARFGVSLADVLARAKAGGWTRPAGGSAGSPPAGGDGGASARVDGTGDAHSCGKAIVVLDQATERIIDDVVQETIDDVVAAHKDITRKLRVRLDAEIDEFDESTKYLSATFRDEAHIRELAAKAKDDGGEALRHYLSQCLAHQAKRGEALEKLGRTGKLIVDTERAVWGLEQDDGGAPAEATYDDLLLELRQKPFVPTELPANIIDFEVALSKGRAPRRKEGK